MSRVKRPSRQTDMFSPPHPLFWETLAGRVTEDKGLKVYTLSLLPCFSLVFSHFQKKKTLHFFLFPPCSFPLFRIPCSISGWSRLRVPFVMWHTSGASSTTALKGIFFSIKLLSCVFNIVLSEKSILLQTGLPLSSIRAGNWLFSHWHLTGCLFSCYNNCQLPTDFSSPRNNEGQQRWTTASAASLTISLLSYLVLEKNWDSVSKDPQGGAGRDRSLHVILHLTTKTHIWPTWSVSQHWPRFFYIIIIVISKPLQFPDKI